MSAVKKTISIDENIANEAIKINSNFSALVEKALIEYMHHYRVQKAAQSFGKWTDRKESGSEYVKNLRKEDDREYVNRNNTKVSDAELKAGHK